MTTHAVQEEVTEVVVIGAGMAGLTAATTLAPDTEMVVPTLDVAWPATANVAVYLAAGNWDSSESVVWRIQSADTLLIDGQHRMTALTTMLQSHRFPDEPGRGPDIFTLADPAEHTAKDSTSRFDVALVGYAQTRPTLRSSAVWDLLDGGDGIAPNPAHTQMAALTDCAPTLDAVLLTDEACGPGGFLAAAYEAIANYTIEQTGHCDATKRVGVWFDELCRTAERFADELETGAGVPAPEAMIVVDTADDDAPLIRLGGRAVQRRASDHQFC